MCKQMITFDTSMLPQGELKIILSLFFLYYYRGNCLQVLLGLGFENVRLCLAVWTDLFWGHLLGAWRGDKVKIIVFSSP